MDKEFTCFFTGHRIIAKTEEPYVREQLKKYITSLIEEKGVTNIPHFGPLYRFRVTQQMGYDSDEIAKTCPVCEEVFYKRFTHLPLYGLTKDQLDYMADAILETIEEMQAGK